MGGEAGEVSVRAANGDGGDDDAATLAAAVSLGLARFSYALLLPLTGAAYGAAEIVNLLTGGAA